jgi:hypothetical protein
MFSKSWRVNDVLASVGNVVSSISGVKISFSTGVLSALLHPVNTKAHNQRIVKNHNVFFFISIKFLKNKELRLF